MEAFLESADQIVQTIATVLQIFWLSLAALLSPVAVGVALWAISKRKLPPFSEGSIDIFGVKLSAKIRQEVEGQRAAREADHTALITAIERIDRLEQSLQDVDKRVWLLFQLDQKQDTPGD